MNSCSIALVADWALRNPSARSLILGAHDASVSFGATLVLLPSELLLPTEPGTEAIVRTSRRHAVVHFDGAILVNDGSNMPGLPRTLGTAPHVRVDTSGRMSGGRTIVADHAQAAKSIVDLLVQAGHRRIGYVGAAQTPDGPPDAWVNGVVHALLDADVFDPSLIFGDLPTAAGGRRSASQALCRVDAATALVCFNGRVAIGVYQAAADLHLRIPDMLSIFALDDAEAIAEDLRPPLSCLHLPYYDMGRQAVQSLLKILSSPDDQSEIKIGYDIVRRESDGCAAPQRVIDMTLI